MNFLPPESTFRRSARSLIQITPHIRNIVAVEPVDFRKGLDGLAANLRQRLKSDPFSGAVFVFVNKSRYALRLLIYDGISWIPSMPVLAASFRLLDPLQNPKRIGGRWMTAEMPNFPNLLSFLLIGILSHQDIE